MPTRDRYLPAHLRRGAPAGVGGAGSAPAPPTPTRPAGPSQAASHEALGSRGTQSPAAQPTASTAPRQGSAAARLQVALLGGKFDWKDQALMRSDAVVGALQAGLKRQAQQTIGAIGSIARPVVRYYENETSEKFRAAVTVVGLGIAAAGAIAGPIAADTPAGAALARKWKADIARLAPASLAVAALAGAVASMKAVSPGGRLRELERIGEGPHAQSLAELVDRLLESRPQAVREEAVRPILLEALPALERIQQGRHASTVLDLVDHLLPIAWSDPAVAPSVPIVLAALPALERMAQGQHAPQMLSLALSLARELMDSGTDRAGRGPVLLAALDALAGPHAPAVSELIRALCPPSPGGVDAAALTGLAQIAEGPDAAAVLDFVRTQIDACPEESARATLLPRMAAALPVLGDLAHSTGSTDVLGAFRHMLRNHATDSTRAALQLALLEQLPAFGTLFAQSPEDARAVWSIALQGYRRRDRLGSSGRQSVAAAVHHLAELHQLNRLLGLSASQAAKFWLSKAGSEDSRR